MTDHRQLFTIGELARRAGVPVRTIRFWSDAGLVPPAARSPSGYRLYDAAATARLDLVLTLRELGVDLAGIQQVLAGQGSLAELARTHVRALDGQIRMLLIRRAVLRTVAEREATTKEWRLMHDLARLSAAERQRMIDEFVDATFHGVDPQAPGAGLAAAMRAMPAELPAEPSAEQVDAWIELAELVADDGFRQRVRQMALVGTRAAPAPPPVDPALVARYAGAAVADGVDPRSAPGQRVLERLIGADRPAAERDRLAGQLETFTDRRVERYWQLIGVLNGRAPFPPAVPAYEWLISALRAGRP